MTYVCLRVCAFSANERAGHKFGIEMDHITLLMSKDSISDDDLTTTFSSLQANPALLSTILELSKKIILSNTKVVKGTKKVKPNCLQANSDISQMDYKTIT
jgi:hypothetical protein